MYWCQRIDAFKLWFWRRLLGVPWTVRKSNQSILKKINPEYSLEGLMLKLKLQHFGHLMWRADSLEKTLMRGKIEGKRRRGWQIMRSWMASLTQWTWVWANSRRWWWTGKPGMLQSMGSQRVGHNWATGQQQSKYMITIVQFYEVVYIHRTSMFKKRLLIVRARNDLEIIRFKDSLTWCASQSLGEFLKKCSFIDPIPMAKIHGP